MENLPSPEEVAQFVFELAFNKNDLKAISKRKRLKRVFVREVAKHLIKKVESNY